MSQAASPPRARLPRSPSLGDVRPRTAIAGVLYGTLALLAGGGWAAAQPAAPPRVLALVGETSGDLFLDTVRVYWRPLADPFVVRYDVRWSIDPQADPAGYAVLRTVNQDALKPWIETTVNIGARSILDSRRVFLAVTAEDASGVTGPAGVTSAILGAMPSLRGDVNEDGERDLQDAIALVFHLFGGGGGLSTLSKSYASDVNGDGAPGLDDALALLAWLFAAGPEPIEAEPAPRKRILTGAFQGEGCPMYRSIAQIQAMEAWQGKKHAVIQVFSNWSDGERSDLFSFQLPNLWRNGNVPMISWQPHPQGSGPCVYDRTPEDIEARIASGEHDVYIRDWAARLRTWLAGPDQRLGAPGTRDIADDRRAYLRLAHEMNGWWTPWNASTGGNRPADYVAMWRRVHAILTQEAGLGPSHVQWVWCVNNLDSDATDGSITHPAEEYYPGDAHVDWISMDGYNWGLSQPWTVSWDLPLNVFNGNYDGNRMLGRLRALAPGKPLCVAEYGSTSVHRRNPTGYSTEVKARWITEMLNYSALSSFGMILYFNIDKETDWAIFGGARGDETVRFAGQSYWAYSTYREALASSLFVSSTPENPRLLTDEEFQGSPP